MAAGDDTPGRRSARRLISLRFSRWGAVSDQFSFRQESQLTGLENRSSGIRCARLECDRMVVEGTPCAWIQSAGCVQIPRRPGGSPMRTVDSSAVLESWLSGSESAHGLANPAGPLYVGGNAAEAALVDP